MTRSRWHMLAAVLGGALALWLLSGDQSPDAAGHDEPIGLVLATGVVQQTSDLSDFYYVGDGLTLSGPPNGVAVMQLRELVRTGKRYRIVAVPEARELKTLERK